MREVFTWTRYLLPSGIAYTSSFRLYFCTESQLNVCQYRMITAKICPDVEVVTINNSTCHNVLPLVLGMNSVFLWSHCDHHSLKLCSQESFMSHLGNLFFFNAHYENDFRGHASVRSCPAVTPPGSTDCVPKTSPHSL